METSKASLTLRHAIKSSLSTYHQEPEPHQDQPHIGISALRRAEITATCWKGPCCDSCPKVSWNFQKKMRWGRGDDLLTLFESYNNLNDGRLKSHWMIYGWQRVTSVAGCQLSAVKRWKLSDVACSICQYATVSCSPGIEWGAWGVSSRCHAWTQPP